MQTEVSKYPSSVGVSVGEKEWSEAVTLLFGIVGNCAVSEDKVKVSIVHDGGGPEETSAAEERGTTSDGLQCIKLKGRKVELRVHKPR